jgi:hypothetical protein
MVPRDNRKFALVMANAGFTRVLREKKERKKKEENSVTVCDSNITVGANKPFFVSLCVQLPFTVISVASIFSF